MSEQEKFEQVGRLAEEVSRLKGEINHINEKLFKVFSAAQRLAQSTGPNYWSVSGDTLIIPTNTNYGNQTTDFSGLISKHELIEVLEHKQKLTAELSTATERLRGLAPHLL